MYRDITLITNNICAYIQDDKTIISYNGDDFVTYKLISNKYYPTYTETTSNPFNTNIVCYTTQQLETLPSTYDFITPIYHGLAIVSAITLFYLAYSLVIYPFFRKI
jgi:hypothetical protein